MRIRIAVCGVLLAALSTVGSAQAQNDPPKLPKFDEVIKAVREQLSQTAGYKTGDILSQRDVQPVFPKLEKLGWNVEDQKDILADVLADSDYLVVQLRSADGVKMQRKIGMTPMSYDYLDRIRNMPHGTYRVRELIEGPDGYTMIQYMTSTPYGHNLTKQLTKAQNGKDFDKPTGRLYNEPLLVARLKASYDAETQRRDGKNKKSKSPAKAAPKK